MGNKMAPSYANIFMNSLERRYLESKTLQQALWKHYFDNILCVWSDLHFHFHLGTTSYIQPFPTSNLSSSLNITTNHPDSSLFTPHHLLTSIKV